MNAGPSDGRALASTAVADFLRYAADTFSLISLTQDSTRVLININNQLRALDVPPIGAKGEAQQHSIEERAAVAESEVERDFPLLNAHALMGIWGALEACIDDVCVGWTMETNAGFARAAVSRLRVSLGEFIYLPEPDRWRWLVEQLKRDQAAALKAGIGQFESVLASIGIGGEIDRDIRKVLFIVKAMRNVVAHRGGRADSKFLSDWTDSGLSFGDNLRISTDQVHSAVFAMIIYVEALFARLKLAAGESPSPDDFPDWVPSPASLLKSFEGTA